MVTHQKQQKQQEPAAPQEYAATREIDGVQYGTRHMNPERLVRHAAKAPALLRSLKEGTFAFDESLMTILQECFDLASADGRELGRGHFWKVHFLGRQGALAGVILWMLEVHFVPFLAGGQRALGDAMASLGAQLGSPADPQE